MKNMFIPLFAACLLATAACAESAPTPQPDTSTDTHVDISPETDTAPSCEHVCLDDFGKSKKGLCPAPVSEWNCVKGCCEAVFRCSDDSDCAKEGVSEGQCKDLGYDCRCNVSDGVCFDWYCAVNSDCAEGETCTAGKCNAAPDNSGLSIRFANQSRVIATGHEVQLLVEAYNPESHDTVIAIEVTFESSDSDMLAVSAEGIVTGGTKEGVGTITATSTSDASKKATIELRNVSTTEADTLVVIATKRNSTEAVSGRYALIESTSGAALSVGDIPANGTITYTDVVPEGGIDVHVLGDTTDWLSVLGLEEGTYLLSGGHVVWSDLSVTKDNAVDLEESTLDGMRVLSGMPDFSGYDKTGEFEVTLNCFALSHALFDFSLDAILGPDVSRYFHPETSIPGVDKSEPAQMPGGVTFGLGGPALPEYWLPTTPGNKLLWTLGGRVELAEVAPIIGDVMDAISGGSDLDIGKLVSAIIPLFGSFWSAINPDITAEPGEASDILSLDPKLRIPMGLSSDLTIPPLPPVADKGWADALFMIAGAFTADGNMIPLGLNAGTDTVDAKLYPADGLADGDQETPEVDPFTVPFAMLHSGLGGPHTRYGIATVAAIIRGSDDPRPEGGSAILTVAESQERLPASVELDDFLGFPLGSSWDPETRVLSVEPLAGADTQRVLFKGKKGAHWTIWMRGQETYTVPHVSDLFEGAEIVDRADDYRLVLVNSFDFQEGVGVDDILTPGGTNLDLLLNVTKRVSFVDIRPKKKDDEAGEKDN